MVPVILGLLLFIVLVFLLVSRRFAVAKNGKKLESIYKKEELRFSLTNYWTKISSNGFCLNAGVHPYFA